MVCTSWGGILIVSRSDAIGQGLLRSSVHELPITELLWRLTGPDDMAVDVGANVGYYTALFAERASHVLSFEPLPAHRERFRLATTHWCSTTREKLEIWEEAVSDRCGIGTLEIPADFASNEGRASLELDGDLGPTLSVRIVTLDDALDCRPVGVMKIDVERHEMAALRGAREALAAGRIRDIVFEDHEPLPTQVSEHLADHGYSIFGVAERPFGIDLCAPVTAPRPQWDAPNYLATLDPDRALRLTRPRGWRSLRPRRCKARRHVFRQNHIPTSRCARPSPERR